MLKSFAKNRRGAVIPLMAILIPALLLLAGLAINVAFMQLTATELQISTDSSARAAGRRYISTESKSDALDIANQLGSLNLVAGDPLQFKMSSFEFGQSTRASIDERYQFTNTNGVEANSVRLVGARNSAINGPVGTLFPIGRTTFEISSSAISTQMEVDVCIVFDRSGSMAYADDEPAVYPPIPSAAPTGWDFGDPVPNDSRWLDAVVAANEFLKSVTASPLNERLALATYADAGTIDVDLTNNFPSILAGLNSHSAKLDGGGTNIAGGLQAGQAALSAAGARPFAAKVVIIMTDGQQTVGPNPKNRAREMADDGMMLICVTFSDEADQGLMQELASIGNGFYIHAQKKSDLKVAFEDIAKLLPTLLTK